MSIKIKVRQIEQLYNRLDSEISRFQSQTNLHCVAGCGKCCTKQDLEASPLEFLPWAFHLFLNGQAEHMLTELKKSSSLICNIYQPLSLVDNNNGSCGNYKYRGLICRLFGYGATKDKYGKLRLATCKIIKEGQYLNLKTAEEAIVNGLHIPIFTDYYMTLIQYICHKGKIFFLNRK